MGDFRKLEVWQTAHQLTCDIYRATQSFPKAEQFGLTSQIRRAAVSIGANIAEGCGRNNDGDLSRSLAIALGSANELWYLILIAVDLGHTGDASLRDRCARLCAMLARFRTTVISSRKKRGG